MYYLFPPSILLFEYLACMLKWYLQGLFYVVRKIITCDLQSLLEGAMGMLDYLLKHTRAEIYSDHYGCCIKLGSLMFS